MESSNPLLPNPNARNSKDLTPKERENSEIPGAETVARKQREWSPSKPQTRPKPETRPKVAARPLGKPSDVNYSETDNARDHPITQEMDVQPHHPSTKTKTDENIAFKELVTVSTKPQAKPTDDLKGDAETSISDAIKQTNITSSAKTSIPSYANVPSNKISDAKTSGNNTSNSKSRNPSPGATATATATASQGRSSNVVTKITSGRHNSQKNEKSNKKSKDSKMKKKEASRRPEVTSIPQTNFALGLLVTCCFNCPFGVLAMYCSLRAAAAYRDGDKKQGLSRARASILLSLFGIMLTMVVVSSVVVWISVNRHSKNSYRLPSSSSLGF